MARSRMADQEKKTEVNIDLIFLLPVSLQCHLTSMPCTPCFSWILPGYSCNRDLHFSSRSHSCCKRQEAAVLWHGSCWALSCLMTFSFQSFAVFFSLPHFLPLDPSDRTAWAPLE